ncbi:ATP-binding protein [Paenibacillus sp. J22TS3]|uniref:ATP-binding protein n=1 Tax=Paenibacillus sp. J22TS3 TaxID=2807192 RepID=UPI001B259F94|nr:sensor histidine kinase [Paenibacillus sp. J22TS3]GIP23260.1 ATPase [Paenibacillus sp. J22TS3]
MVMGKLLIVLFSELVMFVQIIYFFNSVLGRSATKRSDVLYFLIYGVLGYIYGAVPMSFTMSSVIALLLIISLAQTYRVEMKEKITFIILYGVLISIVNFISNYILGVTDFVDFTSLDLSNEHDQLLLSKSTFLSLAIMFVVIQIIRLITKRRSFSLHYRYYILFMIVPIFSIYQLDVLPSHGEMKFHFFISAIGFLFINVLIIFVFDTMIDKFQFRHENAKLQQQMDYQDSNYEKTVHSFKSIKRIIHDTNQHFLYIEECIKQNELEAAVKHIHATLQKVEGAYQRVNTGNLVIDALITNALTVGQANGIRMDTKLALLSPELAIDRYDLCVVLGNMLDNAIEASKQVNIAEDRYVLIKIFSTDAALFIHIFNHTSKEVTDLRSQKANPEFHGMGLTNINKICDKYGGHMSIEMNRRTFHNMVMLPF